MFYEIHSTYTTVKKRLHKIQRFHLQYNCSILKSTSQKEYETCIHQTEKRNESSRTKSWNRPLSSSNGKHFFITVLFFWVTCAQIHYLLSLFDIGCFCWNIFCSFFKLFTFLSFCLMYRVLYWKMSSCDVNRTLWGLFYIKPALMFGLFFMLSLTWI